MTPAQVRQSQLNELYENDFCQWAEQTARLLKEGKFAELDLDNLIEEVEDMSGSQKRALLSNLRVLLLYLLKYQYQPNKRTQSWRSSIIEHRLRIQEAFEESPSLKPYFSDNFDRAYQKARKQASLETELPIQTFPPGCPLPMESVLTDEWMLE